MENIEELLNGIKDFVEGQKEIDEATGSISEFLEDVALATDLDKDTGDDDRFREIIAARCIFVIFFGAHLARRPLGRVKACEAFSGPRPLPPYTVLPTVRGRGCIRPDPEDLKDLDPKDPIRRS